jgi:hypothetical protein
MLQHIGANSHRSPVLALMSHVVLQLRLYAMLRGVGSPAAVMPDM